MLLIFMMSRCPVRGQATRCSHHHRPRCAPSPRSGRQAPSAPPPPTSLPVHAAAVHLWPLALLAASMVAAKQLGGWVLQEAREGGAVCRALPAGCCQAGAPGARGVAWLVAALRAHLQVHGTGVGSGCSVLFVVPGPLGDWRVLRGRQQQRLGSPPASGVPTHPPTHIPAPISAQAVPCARQPAEQLQARGGGSVTNERPGPRATGCAALTCSSVVAYAFAFRASGTP